MATLLACLVAAVPAVAARRVPPPQTTGPEPAGLEQLREVPGPAGGPVGRPLIDLVADLPVVGVVQELLAPLVTLSLPEQWCGAERPVDQLDGELANGGYKFHAIYAYPSDAIGRFSRIASAVQADALQASALLERLYGVAIRFDMGTTCGTQFLDISSVRLRATTAQLQAAAASGTLFSLLVSEIQAAGFSVIQAGEPATIAAARTKNYVVWYDGPAPANVCGQAMLYDDHSRGPGNWNDYAGKVAVVFRSPTGSGFCNSNTVRHEIAHTLGALQSAAPHESGDGHCTDAYEDTMCIPHAPRRSSGAYHALYFDYNRDDYWDPKGGSLPHWTLNLSRFLCPDIGCNVPGGSATGGFLDSDGDLIPNILDPCPYVRGVDCPVVGGPDAHRREPTRVRASASARRRSGGRWRVRIRVTGNARARVVVRCGRKTVYRRTVAPPRTITVTRRCSTRPRVSASAVRS